MSSPLPPPLNALASDILSFYEKIGVARGMESKPNPTMTAVCTGASLIFKAEANVLGFQVDTVSCRITDQDKHKKKLRTFIKNSLALYAVPSTSSPPVPSRHTWNVWDKFVVDLTARQFGFEGNYYVGAETFLSDIKHETLSANSIKPFDKWLALEMDLPDFRAWRAAGRDWTSVKPWSAETRQLAKQKLLELSTILQNM